MVECLLAISLFLWYRETISPALRHCSPNLPLQSAVTCECTSGFVDPPSLRTTIHQFKGVSDCSSFADKLDSFHWALLSLHAVGVLVTALAGFLAARRLHSFGVCGKSGVYAVTPEPDQAPPTPDLAPSQQVSPVHEVMATSRHSPPGFPLSQR